VGVYERRKGSASNAGQQYRCSSWTRGPDQFWKYRARVTKDARGVEEKPWGCGEDELKKLLTTPSVKQNDVWGGLRGGNYPESKWVPTLDIKSRVSQAERRKGYHGVNGHCSPEGGPGICIADRKKKTKRLQSPKKFGTRPTMLHFLLRGKNRTVAAGSGHQGGMTGFWARMS